jgi:hypothetical protein
LASPSSAYGSLLIVRNETPKPLANDIKEPETRERCCPQCARFRPEEGFRLKGLRRGKGGHLFRLFICAVCWEFFDKAKRNRDGGR